MSQETSTHGESKITFAQVAREGRGLILGAAILGVIGGLAFRQFAPNVYEARTLIVFPSRSSGLSIGGLDTDQLGGLGGALGLGSSSPIRMFSGILQSDTVLSYVQENTGITRKKLKGMRMVKEDPGSGAIAIIAQADNEELARNICKLHTKALKEMSGKLALRPADADLKLIQRELAKYREDLERSRTRLKQFYQTSLTNPNMSAPTGTSANPAAPKSSASVVVPSNWKDQLTAAAVDLGSVNSQIETLKKKGQEMSAGSETLPRDNPNIKTLREKLVQAEYDLEVDRAQYQPGDLTIKNQEDLVRVTKEQIAVELKRYGKAFDEGRIDPFSSRQGAVSYTDLLVARVSLESKISALKKLVNVAPSEANTLQEIVDQTTSLSTIVNGLRNQEVTASIQIQRDPSRWEIVDDAYLDPDPINKRLSIVLGTSIFLGLVVGFGLAYLRVQGQKS